MAWSKTQVSEFRKTLRRDIGDAWSWLTPRVQRALVAEFVFSIVRSQDAAAVTVADMDALLRDLEAAMGLRDKES